MTKKLLRTTALCVLVFLSATANRAADKKIACQLVKVADLPVTITPANVVLTAGSIKGKPVEFRVVTGDSGTILDYAAISRFDITPNYRETTGHNLSGEAKYLHAMIPEITVGTFKIDNKVFPIAESHLFSDPVYGSIGNDIFESFDLDMDISKGNIGLFQHNPCSSEPIYWANTFSEADLSISGRIIEAEVEVNGTPTRALIDTGAPRSVIMLSFAQRLGIDIHSPGVVQTDPIKGVYGDPMPAYKYRFSELKVGDEAVKNPTLLIANFLPYKHDFRSMSHVQGDNYGTEGMILGADFIRQHHIYLSIKDKKIYFTWNGGSIFAPPTEDAAISAGSK